MSFDISNFASYSHEKDTSSSVVKSGASYVFQYPCSSKFVCSPFTVSLERGAYLLETWGAKGGDNALGSSGGFGGYSRGILDVYKGKTLFLYLGGRGQSQATFNAKGGYNGGGEGRNSTLALPHGGGGGSTDFRLTHNLPTRILVAGAGGGAGQRGTEVLQGGGYGGGALAGNGKSINNGWGGNGASSINYGAGGGGAGNGDIFIGGIGKGGDISSGGGGGSGYFGGGGGLCAGGGGGSGFYGKLRNGETVSGNLPFPSPLGTPETGHAGDGAAKITILSNVPWHFTCPVRQYLSSHLLISFLFIFFAQKS